MSDALIREDAAARSAAIDTGRSLIVQAPAGAGKTELLIRRVLALLATVEAPEAIIAITFTRKAAAEMRQRILAQLAAAASDTPPAEPYMVDTWRLARAARAHAKAQGWELDETPQRLRVMTIDALCAALVRQSPTLSETGGGLTVTENAGALHAEAARAALAHLEGKGAAADAIAAALRHFDNSTATLESQLAALLGGRERWRRLLDPGAREDMEATLAALVGDRLSRLRDAFGVADRSTLLQLSRFAAEHAEPDSPVHTLAALDDLGDSVDALPHWLALADVCMTKTNGVRKSVNVKQGFPPGATFKAQKEAMNQLLGRIAGRTDLVEHLAAARSLPHPHYHEAQWQALADLLAVLRLAMAELQVIFAARGEVDFTEIALRALTALGEEDSPGELLLRLDHRLQHLLVDEFQDTSQMQIELLRRLTAGWCAGDGRSLFLVGDPMQSIYRFRHANVGLFLGVRRDGLRQDLPLDPLNLRLNFRSQQGIVDWVNRVFGVVLPAEDDIGGGQVAYAQARAHHPPLAEPALRWHAQLGDDRKAEAHAIAERCRELRDAGERAAILVRARGHLAAIVPALREAGVPYTAVDIEGLNERPVIDDLRALTLALCHPGDRLSWLAVLRAPWCGLTLADLSALTTGIGKETPLLLRLQALVAVVGAHSWATADAQSSIAPVAHGWAPAEDASLVGPTANGDVPPSGDSAVTHEWAPARDEDAPPRLSEDGLHRLQRALAVLLPAIRQRGRIPLRRLVEQVWLDLGGPACVQAERDLHDAQRFFETLDRLGPEPLLSDPAALDRLLGELRAAVDPEAGDSLQIMTIHKAKGLQFDHVLLPGLGRGSRSGESPAVLASFVVDAHDEEVPLLAAKPPRGGDDPIYEFLRRQIEAARDTAETDRLLYVAATRAVKCLHLFGHLDERKDGSAEPRKGSLLARLWPAIESEFNAALPAQALARPAASQEDEPPLSLLRRLPLHWQPPSGEVALSSPAESPDASAAPPAFEWAGEAARFTGTLYHRWVQLIGEHAERAFSAADVERLKPALRAEAERAGLPDHEVPLIVDNVTAALINTLDDERGRWLLAHRPDQAWSEYSLTTVGEDGRLERHILDRSFIDDEGTRWIIDFKSGRHEGGDLDTFITAERKRYGDQLRRYRSLFEHLPQPIRLALYYPLLPEGRRFIEVD